MAPRYGTEVSYRLGPGSADEARAIASDLARAAHGCARHVLFLDPEAGEYGCLAEWERLEDAIAYGTKPETREALARLEARTGKPPRVRRYEMQEISPPQG